MNNLIIVTIALDILFAICHHIIYPTTNVQPCHFGLDHHIPSKTDSNLIYNKFECYYQNIVHKIEKCQMIGNANLKPK